MSLKVGVHKPKKIFFGIFLAINIKYFCYMDRYSFPMAKYSWWHGKIFYPWNCVDGLGCGYCVLYICTFGVFGSRQNFMVFFNKQLTNFYCTWLIQISHNNKGVGFRVHIKFRGCFSCFHTQFMPINVFIYRNQNFYCIRWIISLTYA